MACDFEGCETKVPHVHVDVVNAEVVKELIEAIADLGLWAQGEAIKVGATPAGQAFSRVADRVEELLLEFAVACRAV